MLSADLMGCFFQLGYVTPDLDAAMALYRERFGVERFRTFSSRDLNPDATNPIRVGLAWTGPVMVELIEASEEHPLYGCAMPRDGFGVRLHHLGYLVRDQAAWEGAVAGLAEPAAPIVATGQLGMLEFVYADARPMLGHHLEIVWAKPEGMAFFDAVPRN